MRIRFNNFVTDILSERRYVSNLSRINVNLFCYSLAIEKLLRLKKKCYKILKIVTNPSEYQNNRFNLYLNQKKKYAQNGLEIFLWCFLKAIGRWNSLLNESRFHCNLLQVYSNVINFAFISEKFLILISSVNFIEILLELQFFLYVAFDHIVEQLWIAQR